MMDFIFYFLAGVLQDFLVTLDWRFISSGKVIPAVLFSFLSTVVGMLVLYNIITKLDTERSVVAIVVYALGIACGTFFAMKFKFGFRK